MRPNLLLAACLLALPPAAAAAPIRTLHDEMPAGSAPSFQVKSELGDLVLDSWDQPFIEVDLQISCKAEPDEKCRKAAAAIALSWTRGSEQLQLRTRGSSRLGSRHLEVVTRVKVPARLPLELDLVAGTITVNGVGSDIEADLGSGDVRLRLPKAAVHAVSLKVGAGSVELYVGGGKVDGSGLFRSLNWDGGEGTATIGVVIGTGHATVRLE